MLHRRALRVASALFGTIMLTGFLMFSVAGRDFTGVVHAQEQEESWSIPELRLESNTSGHISVSWDAPEAAPKEYRVVWAPDEESFPDRSDTDGNAFLTGTSHAIGGLAPGARYKVKVRARYSDGNGPWSQVERIVVFGGHTSTPTATATPTPTETPPPAEDTATPTPTETPTESPPPVEDTATPTPTETPTESPPLAEDTATPTPTETPTESPPPVEDTATPTPTETPPSVEDTATPTPTETPPSAEDTVTPTPTETATESPPSVEDTATPTPTETATESPPPAEGTATPTPTETPIESPPLAEGTATPTPTETATESPPSADDTATPTPTETPPSADGAATPTPTSTQASPPVKATPTATTTLNSVSLRAENTPTPTPTPTVTLPPGEDTATPTPTPTETPAEHTATATATATPTATLSPVQAQRDVLVALYHATDGPNWKNNSNWLSNEPLGKWFGVQVHWNGEVAVLNLSSNELAGELPSDLGNLSSLQYLVLYSNDLTGTIPPELGNLANLNTLYLHQNALSGPIPSELGRLGALQILELSYNNLTGTIPSSLGSLSNLTRLGLNSNNLSGAIPSSLGGLSNLKILNLHHNSLTGTIPPEIGNLSSVEHLSARVNQLSGALPNEIGQLPNLKFLHLDHNKLSGEIPASIGGLAKAEKLYLNDNELTGSIPIEIGAMTKLKNLNLKNNNLDGWIPAELTTLRRLSLLYLGGNAFTGCVPAAVYWDRFSDTQELGIPSCAERTVLTALYNATDGASWTDSANWLSEEPLGSWHGVTTDAEGLVTGLSLASNGLSGTIPSELAELTNLDTLHLSGNSLKGCLPGALYDVATNDLNAAGIPSCDRDKNALVALYNATAGASWTDSANWLSEEPLGSWHGVTTDGDGLVTGLSLASNGLVGTIPNDLVDLTNLETLQLSGNSLSGCVPGALYDVATHDLDSAGISSCDKDKAVLEALYRATDGGNWTNSSNWLSGEPVSSWYGVTIDSKGNVTGVSLASNGLSGTIPSELLDLTELETLHLSGNSLSGCMPEALYEVATHDLDSAGIPSCGQDKAPLVALYNATDGTSWTDSANWLSEEPLGTWHGVTTDGNGLVTGLSLSGNGLSGTIPSELLDLTELETLHLSGNSLSGCVPGALYDVATNDLDSVGIPSCDQDKEPLVALYNATGGASWTNSANWLSDEPLGSWHGVTTDGNGLVTGLSLANNGLSGTIPSELLDLTNLETLHLGGNSLSGCAPGALYDVTTNDLDSAGIP